MGFGQELRDFVNAASAGVDVAIRSRKIAMQEKYYQTQSELTHSRAKFYDERAQQFRDGKASPINASLHAQKTFQAPTDEAVPTTSEAPTSGGTSGTQVADVGPTQEQTLALNGPNDHFGYLRGKGVPPEAAAGLVGNIAQESSGAAGAIGDGGHSKGLYQFNDKGAGPAMRDWMAKNNRDPSDPKAQHDFVLDDLKSNYPKTWNKLVASKDPESAAHTFMAEYERPDPNSANLPARQQAARSVYDAYSQNVAPQVAQALPTDE